MVGELNGSPDEDRGENMMPPVPRLIGYRWSQGNHEIGQARSTGSLSSRLVLLFKCVMSV